MFTLHLQCLLGFGTHAMTLYLALGLPLQPLRIQPPFTYNPAIIFNISLRSYNVIITIFKHNSHMVMICVVEYPVTKNNIPSRRMKSLVIPTMVLNTAVCLRPLFPGCTTCKGTGRFFRMYRDFESRSYHTYFSAPDL